MKMNKNTNHHNNGDHHNNHAQHTKGGFIHMQEKNDSHKSVHHKEEHCAKKGASSSSPASKDCRPCNDPKKNGSSQACHSSQAKNGKSCK